MKINITIADDHPVVTEGLIRILGDCRDFRIISTCENGTALLESLSRQAPDVLLLDIQMPGKQGDELCRIVSETYPAVAILVLTNLNQVFNVRNMLLYGAMGYLLKSSDRNTLSEAIRTVHQRRQYIDPKLREDMFQDMIEQRAQHNEIPTLTEREKEILNLIVHEHTSPEIAKKLFISLSAVENHRLNLLFKLNVKNVAGLVRKSIQLGLTDSK